MVMCEGRFIAVCGGVVDNGWTTDKKKGPSR